MQVGDMVKRSKQTMRGSIGAIGIIVDVVVSRTIFEVHWFDVNSTFFTNATNLEIISKCMT